MPYVEIDTYAASMQSNAAMYAHNVMRTLLILHHVARLSYQKKAGRELSIGDVATFLRSQLFPPLIQMQVQRI